MCVWVCLWFKNINIYIYFSFLKRLYSGDLLRNVRYTKCENIGLTKKKKKDKMAEMQC